MGQFDCLICRKSLAGDQGLDPGMAMGQADARQCVQVAEDNAKASIVDAQKGTGQGLRVNGNESFRI